jgi:Zn-finger nucleic acid-binding protein
VTRCPHCPGYLTPETRAGITVDRCERCGGLWFDAEELDRCLAHIYPDGVPTPESRIPSRGVGSRPCPRCVHALETAGWNDLILDRCTTCRGLFVESKEFLHMQKQELPVGSTETFEAWLTERLVEGGWTLLGAGHLTLLILRFLR